MLAGLPSDDPRPLHKRLTPADSRPHAVEAGPPPQSSALSDLFSYDNRVRLEPTHRRLRGDASGLPEIELLPSATDVRARLRDLLGTAARRCLRLWTGGPGDHQVPARIGRPDTLVHYRTICTPESLSGAGPRAATDPGDRPDSRWRVLPDLPMQLTIIDDTAVASVDARGGPALVLQAPALVDALIQYFELLWTRAAPLDPESPFGAGRPSPAQLHVIRMAAAGLKDEAVARTLGRRSRWVRRQMELLEEMSGATNRLTLGIAAAHRKWV